MDETMTSVPEQSRGLRHTLGFVVVAASLAVACNDAAGPDTQAGAGLRFARGSASSEVTVAAAVPDTGSQGVTMDVVINGSGFTSDMQATWEYNGVADPAQVRTNRTTFVNQKQIIANITIGEEAVLAKWDIRVQSGKCCKGGIGVEMFQVKAKLPDAPTATWELYSSLTDGTPSSITGDGRAADGMSVLPGGSSFTGVYQGARCGVRTTIFVPGMAGSGSGDATIEPDADWNRSLNCERRYFSLKLAEGNVVIGGPFTNARAVWSIATVGGTAETTMEWWVATPKCERIVYGDRPKLGDPNPRLGVLITRLADVNGKRQWSVESQAPHAARCIEWIKGTFEFTGPVYTVPFRLSIIEM
jgi:hypothetical protein